MISIHSSVKLSFSYSYTKGRVLSLQGRLPIRFCYILRGKGDSRESFHKFFSNASRILIFIRRTTQNEDNSLIEMSTKEGQQSSNQNSKYLNQMRKCLQILALKWSLFTYMDWINFAPCTGIGRNLRTSVQKFQMRVAFFGYTTIFIVDKNPFSVLIDLYSCSS